MAEDPTGGRGLYLRDNLARPHYHPQSGPEDGRSPAYPVPPPQMNPAMNLPSLQDAHSQYGAPRNYGPPPDPRAAGHYSASPGGANGHPAPHGTVSQHASYQYPPEQRPYGDYYHAPGRSGSHPPQDPYVYQGYRPPSGPPYGYPADYARFGQQAVPPPQQAAPRQRTSIACRYCRKRKIRCSGYQNTTNGKCTNCDKLSIECIFQPVSSNSSTAFIPVSAVPGGVPPGTMLYGAYGQPLQPAGAASAPASFPPHSTDFPHSMTPPAGQYPPPIEDRGDPNRRRPRAPDDDPGLRLPPPNPYGPEDDARRRSPASAHGIGTPPNSYPQYPQGGGHETDRTSTPRSSSGGHPPPSAAPPNMSIMSLGNLVDQGPPPQRHGDSGRDIDQSMLGKLNRRS